MQMKFRIKNVGPCKKPVSAAFLIVALLGMLIPLFTWARKRRQA